MKEKAIISFLKTALLPALLAFTLCMIGYILMWNNSMQEIRSLSNAQTARLVGAIQASYPNVSDEAIVQALSETDETDAEAGRLLFQKYGYPSDMLVSGTLLSPLQAIRGKAILILGALAVLLLLTEARYRQTQTKQIQKLIRYMQNVQSGDYTLTPDDNVEDVLSILKNELYKITVLFRENAENSRRDSENLSRALTDISHQLKTPLTSVRIMLDNITDDPEMEPSVREDFLKSISTQIDQISALIVTLLHLAQFDSGVIRMRPTTFTVRELVEDAISRVAVLADVRGVQLSCSGDLDTNLTADLRWQTEAIVNVLKNCVEHTPQGGRVEVLAESSALFLKLFIRDNGEGMPRSALGHIFDRFYKPPGSISEGIGVGLAFTKTILEKENAFITADSAPQCGTTFVIRYPVQT